MRKIFLVAILSFMAIPCFSQAESAFQEGEYLKFHVRYGIFNASYASLTLKNKTYQGKTVYHALGKGETTGLAKLFFKVDDTYESYFDKETGKPYFFNRDIYEGGYTKKLNFLFNFDSNSVKIKNLENGEEKNMSVQHIIEHSPPRRRRIVMFMRSTDSSIPTREYPDIITPYNRCCTRPERVSAGPCGARAGMRVPDAYYGSAKDISVQNGAGTRPVRNMA